MKGEGAKHISTVVNYNYVSETECCLLKLTGLFQAPGFWSKQFGLRYLLLKLIYGHKYGMEESQCVKLLCIIVLGAESL
jgi:hypothetical protein